MQGTNLEKFEALWERRCNLIRASEVYLKRTKHKGPSLSFISQLEGPQWRENHFVLLPN